MSQYARISEHIGENDSLVGLAEQNPLAALLFTWSLTQVDNDGTLPISPRKYRAVVCPASFIDLKTIAGAIEAQVRHGLLGVVATNKATVKRDDDAWQFGQNISEHVRRSAALRQWREACLLRDNYACQVCGETNGLTDVHHRLSFRHNKADRTIVANGITLCRKHHRYVHSAEGKPLRKQLEQEYVRSKEA